MIIQRIICGIVGHDPDPQDDLVADINLDPRNWMRRCKRCGYYVMHDGVNSGITIALPEKEARQTAEDLKVEIDLIHKYAIILQEPVEENDSNG